MYNSIMFKKIGVIFKESLSFDKDDKVIIMFHGYGSNKDDLFSFAKFMNPNFLIISVQAPIQMDYNSNCWWSLSFNNDGPFGTFFRYICDNGTYLARYDDLYDGENKQIDLTGVDVSNNGIELIDREFISAIRENRPPNACVTDAISAMETLDKIERDLQSD